MIDYDTFYDWCERHFDSVRAHNSAICVNSPFDPNQNDDGHKLWCSPSGGKNHREDGVYHCWISGEKGTLVGLVMKMEGCSYEEAKDILGGDRSLAAMEAKLEAAMANMVSDLPKAVSKTTSLNLPEGVVLIQGINPYDRRRIRAEKYLFGRKLNPKKYFLGISGTYNDRVVIPYYDRSGNLIYYNGRHLWKSDPKYLGPPKELGIGKGDVVYMPEWPEDRVDLYITEGEFDAEAIRQTGLWSAAVGGSQLTWNQIKILRQYNPIIAVDNDEAGEAALSRMSTSMKENGFTEIKYIRSPLGIKDWNDLLIRHNKNILRKYLVERVKHYDGLLI